jgi:hypothetical protein
MQHLDERMQHVGEVFAVLWIAFVGVTYFIPTLLGTVPTGIFTAGYGIFLLVIVARGATSLVQSRNIQNNQNNHSQHPK